jgi:hypothetical protein
MIKMMEMKVTHELVLPHNNFINVHLIKHRTLNKRKGGGRKSDNEKGLKDKDKL